MFCHTFCILISLATFSSLVLAKSDPVKLCKQLRKGTKHIRAISPMIPENKFILLTSDYTALIVPREKLILEDHHRPMNLSLSLGDAIVTELILTQGTVKPGDRAFFFSGKYDAERAPWKGTQLGLISADWKRMTVISLRNGNLVKQYKLMFNRKNHPPGEMLFSAVASSRESMSSPVVGQPIFEESSLYVLPFHADGSSIWMANTGKISDFKVPLTAATFDDVGYVSRNDCLLSFNYRSLTVTWQSLSATSSTSNTGGGGKSRELPISYTFDDFFQCHSSKRKGTIPHSTTAYGGVGFILSTIGLVIAFMAVAFLCWHCMKTFSGKQQQPRTASRKGTNFRVDPAVGYPKVGPVVPDVMLLTPSEEMELDMAESIESKMVTAKSYVKSKTKISKMGKRSSSASKVVIKSAAKSTAKSATKSANVTRSKVGKSSSATKVGKSGTKWSKVVPSKARILSDNKI